MAYGICRCAKVSGASGGSGAYYHNERKKDHSNTNPDIDFSESKLNYSHGIYDSQLSYNERADKRISEGYTGKRAVRKDAVKMVEFLFASSDADSLDNHMGYLRACYNWLCDRYGKENVIADKVHLDEKTPHLHAVIVPLTADGRLSCKEVIGGPKKLQEMQDDFFEKVSKHFGLERGEKADLQNPDREIKKHVPQMKFKAQTIAKLDDEITDKEKKVDELERKAEYSNIKVETLEHQVEFFNKLKDKAEEENESTRESVKKAREELLEIQGDISTLKSEKSKIEDSTADLKHEQKNLERKIYDLTEKKIDLEGEIDFLTQENDTLMEKHIKLEDEYNKLSEEYNNLDDELTELETEIEKKQSLLDNISSGITNYFKKMFEQVETYLTRAKVIAPKEPEKANILLNQTEEQAHTSIDKAVEKGLNKDLADGAKEVITEKVEEAAEQIAETVPTFRRKKGR